MRTIRILSVTAQKPYATGSGVYLCELVRGFEKMGHEQAIIFGGDSEEDCECMDLMAKTYKVAFNSEALPFPVFGMSDNMPYKSSKYKDMDEDKALRFKKAFEKTIIKADKEFQPDIVICHHLYYVTAITANILPHRKVVAICHGTCIRQLENHSFENEYIKVNIQKLYKIYALQDSQRKKIASIFHINEDKIVQIGMGYNSEIFYNIKTEQGRKNKVVYAGKLSPSKGVEYLIRAMEKINEPMELYLAGDGNDRDFINYLEAVSKFVESSSSHKIYFVGRLSQTDLGNLFRKSEIFVLPSFYEGLPLVIIEAIACGLKIVYSKIEGSFQWFEENFDQLTLSGIDIVGTLGDDKEADFDEETFIDNIAKAIIKSMNEEYKIQTEALDNLSWDFLCDRIVKEIG